MQHRRHIKTDRRNNLPQITIFHFPIVSQKVVYSLLALFMKNKSKFTMQINRGYSNSCFALIDFQIQGSHFLGEGNNKGEKRKTK